MFENQNEWNRRDFLKTMGAVSMVTMAGNGINSVFAQTVECKEDLVPILKLPYDTAALEPSISKKTVDQHYFDHHQSYYRRLKAYIEKNPDYGKYPLDKLVMKTKGGIHMDDTIFNIAVLLWNHNFYWQSLTPKGGINPDQNNPLTKAVIVSFGSMDTFKKKFIDRGMELGYGWVWVVKTMKGVEIVRTVYHDSPIPFPSPLLTIDVWEHAYYMDYGADRQRYLEACVDNLLNWEFATNNFTAEVSRK